MSARLDRLLAQRQRDLFLPLSFRLSARLEQMDREEMVEDPVYTAFTLQNGQKLFQADGVVNWFDTHLETEAAGAEVERDGMGRVIRQASLPDSLPEPASLLQQGDIPAALDVARRLCEETLDESAVLGYLTGLHTFLGHLFGKDRQSHLLRTVASEESSKDDREAVNASVQLSLNLARAYCEVGVGGLLLAEEDEIQSLGYLRVLEPLFNIADYYGIPVILLSRHPLSHEQREGAVRSGFRYVAAPDAGTRKEISKETVHAIPTEVLLEEEASVADWLQERRSMSEETGIYVSEWGLPSEAEPETLISMGRLLIG